MRVLYLIDSLAPGGAENSLAGMAPYYADIGIQLDVAYLKEGRGLAEELRGAGASVFSLAGSGGRWGKFQRARALIRRRAPDLVHTTLFEADVLGRAAAWSVKVPVVSSLVNLRHGPEQRQNPNRSPTKMQVVRAADMVSARTVARFHALTNAIADVMAQRLRIRRELIDVIPRGRDSGVLGQRSPDRREKTRAALRISERTPLVIAVARQDFQKGLDVLLDALPVILQRLPETQVLLAGRGGDQSSLIEHRKHVLGISDRFVSLGVRDDVADLLVAADVFVLPSRWEGQGCVLLEAMALEAPIVASDLPAVRETVGTEIASLVPPNDAASLGHAIIEALEKGHEARARALRGRARFLDRFTMEKIVDQMAQFYARAISPGGRASRVV